MPVKKSDLGKMFSCFIPHNCTTLQIYNFISNITNSNIDPNQPLFMGEIKSIDCMHF